MNLKRPSGRPVALVGLAATGLLLSGCGSLGIHLGAAAVVGDRSVSMHTIDSTATSFCKAYVHQQQSSSSSQSGPLPMGTFRSYVASSLAKRALGDQLARQYDVQPASDYASTVAQYETSLATSTPAERDAVVQVAAADAFLENVEVSIGANLTGDHGAANADLKRNLQRGQAAATTWLAHHRVAIDPVFDLAVNDGKFTPQVDQTSFPLSPLASAGVASVAQPSSTFAQQLPSAQVCGPQT